MWKPSLQPRSFGPRILDNTSSLPLSCHRRVHSTASTCLSRHCAFFQSNVQVNKISVLAPYMSISRRGLLASRMQLSSIILVTEAKNRFPLFCFWGGWGATIVETKSATKELWSPDPRQHFMPVPITSQTSTPWQTHVSTYNMYCSKYSVQPSHIKASIRHMRTTELGLP